MKKKEKKDIILVTWGSREHLKQALKGREVRELSRKCKATRVVKADITAVATEGNGLRVVRVFDVESGTEDAPVHTTVAHVQAGVEPPDGCYETQEEALKALAKLAKGGRFLVIEVVSFPCGVLDVLMERRGE